MAYHYGYAWIHVMRFRKLFASLLFAVAGNVYATPERALLVFDAYCFGFDGKIEALEKMVKALGGKPLSPEIANADPVMARDGGKLFKVSYQGLAFVVAVTFPGTCSVIFPKHVTPKIQHLLEANYPLSQPSTDSEGPQVTKLYRILHPSAHQGGYVSYVSAKPGFGADEAVALGFVPKEVWDKAARDAERQ